MFRLHDSPIYLASGIIHSQGKIFNLLAIGGTWHLLLSPPKVKYFANGNISMKLLIAQK